ncbi:EutP/PduV family microcompartment system protein [uncultured Veillonella sp.]|uniref:EutP/PduV family microcompartment system protein n=1 Tax=uncultured Veillonella sp. TaxID=159268 RepID=UPI0026093631|nr:EutP/PduV family microcompartment system protein [uncultured Veillonella sp.]
MIKKRIMIVGPGRSGKSTLANIFNEVQRPARRTQDIIYGKYTIDTPSVYLEMPHNYKYLVATSQEANVLVCVIDPLTETTTYPPLFATSFNCIPVGVISKADLANERQLQNAKKYLVQLGIEEEHIFTLDLLKALEGESTAELEALLAYRKHCRI